MSIGDVMRWMQAILTALEHAHRHGVIHRDMKPANVIPAQRRAAEDRRFRRGAAGEFRDDAGGHGTGHARLHNPERLMGMAVDGPRRSVLVRRDPVPAAHRLQTVRRWLRHHAWSAARDPVPPTQLNQTPSPAWDAVVRRAMAKQPAERFQTAADSPPPSAEAAIGDNEPTVLMPRPSAGASAGTMAGSLSARNRRARSVARQWRACRRPRRAPLAQPHCARSRHCRRGLPWVHTSRNQGRRLARWHRPDRYRPSRPRRFSDPGGSTTGTRTGLRRRLHGTAAESTPAGGAHSMLGARSRGRDWPRRQMAVPGGYSAASPSTSAACPPPRGPVNRFLATSAQADVRRQPNRSRRRCHPSSPDTRTSRTGGVKAVQPQLTTAVTTDDTEADVQPSGSQAPSSRLLPTSGTKRGSLASVPGASTSRWP